MASRNTTSVKSNEIFKALIKDVFGTYSFPETKWNNVIHIPNIGRTYFQDRKDKECPINRECVEKIRDLYDSALSGYMKISDRVVSGQLCKLFKDYFWLECSFLTYFDDDGKELRTKKKAFWLRLLDKVLEFFVDNKEIDYEEFVQIYSEYKYIFNWMENNTENTYTATVIEEMNVPVKQAKKEKENELRKIARDELIHIYPWMPEQVGNKYMQEMERNEGMILFFMNSSITNVTEFIKKFPEYSKLDIRIIPKCRVVENENNIPDEEGTVFVSYEEWLKLRENNKLLPLYEFNKNCSGFLINEVYEGIQNGISYIMVGSQHMYREYRDIFIKNNWNFSCFIVIPEDISRLLFEAESRGYYQEAAKMRFGELMEQIDLIIDVSDTYVIRWQLEDNDKLTAYYAGIIDSVITMNPISKRLNLDFLRDYKTFLDELLEK